MTHGWLKTCRDGHDKDDSDEGSSFPGNKAYITTWSCSILGVAGDERHSVDTVGGTVEGCGQATDLCQICEVCSRGGS